VHENPDEASEIGAQYIAANPRFIRAALEKNRPNVNALHNRETMDAILHLMMELGYIAKRPVDYLDLSFLHRAEADLQAAR
jgi:hypothetical protein